MANITANKFLSTLLFSLILTFILPSAHANDIQQVTELTTTTVKEVISLLKNKKLNKTSRDEQIITIINKIINFKQMAKLSLGAKYWRQLNKDKQEEFVKLFVNKLKLSYLEKLDLYTDEKIAIDTAKKIKKGRIHVKTYLVSGSDKKEMLYKFYKKSTQWFVYDIDILGVSLVQVYRQQFAGMLKKGTINDLLTKMKSNKKI